MNNVNIAMAQINTVSGNIAENTASILNAINKAKKQEAHIIVFPELAVAGYGAQDLLLRHEFLRSAYQAILTIAQICDNIIALVGFPEQAKDGVYSSVAVLGKGKILTIHRKQVLPHLELFAENRYFKTGHSPTVIKIKETTIGIAISEEIFEENLIPICDIVCCSGALPWSRDLSVEREQIFHHLTRLHNTALVFVNDVEMADNLLLEGNSCFVNNQGKTLLRLNHFIEDFAVISTNSIKILTQDIPIKENHTENTYEALSFGLMEFFNKTNHSKAAVYLDNSIESRLNLVLTAKALGAQNVVATHIVSRLDLPSDREKAKQLADKLGVSLFVKILDEDAINKGLIDIAEHSGKQHDYAWQSNTVDRFKSALYLSFAELTEALPLSHINKTQLALGVKTFAGSFTKASFMPLLDLYHRKIIKLAEYLNAKENLFTPEEIHAAYHQKLKHPKIFSGKEINMIDVDEILYRYIESNQSVKQIIASGFEEELVISLIQRLHETEGLRKQSGFGPKMSTRSFSNDWIFPAAAHWNTMNIKEI